MEQWCYAQFFLSKQSQASQDYIKKNENPFKNVVTHIYLSNKKISLLQPTSVF